MPARTFIPKRGLVKSLYINCLKCKRNNMNNNYCPYRVKGLCKGENFFLEKKTRPYGRRSAKQQHTMKRNWLKLRLDGAYSYFKQAHKELTEEEREQFLEITTKIAYLKEFWRKNNAKAMPT